jgi:methyl-accepting chemotaxis protein
MKLAFKLPLAFAASLLLMFAGAMYGIYSLNQSIEEYSTTVQEKVANERAVASMLHTFKLQVQDWKDALLRGKDPAKLESTWSSFVGHEHTVDVEVKELQARLGLGQSLTLIEKFAAAHASMGESYRKSFEAFKAAGFDPTVGDNSVAGVDQLPSTLLEDAAHEIAAESAAVSADAARGARRASIVSVVLMLMSLAAGSTGAVLFSRSITRPLNSAVDVTRTIASGNLSTQFDVRGSDEIAQLKVALKEMQGSLLRVVSNVRQNAEGLATASGQIAQGNLDLSSRTEEQAASLEETASSMEELTSTVRHNADNAKQASTLATMASEIARRGGEVVGRVVETMQGISGSSAKMADIIGVIEGIAFQTNILALNAAVEAARAGEQGRGFAVVAGEVRTLAQRSASAAKEIKDLISESANRVNAGSRLVEEAGSRINEIVESVKRVTDIVGEISSASEEQSTGIEQVNQAVNQMDQVTQQNAALVEEAAAATQSMAQQAQDLRETVAVFRISEATAAVSRIATPQSEPLWVAAPARKSRAVSAKPTPSLIGRGSKSA